MLNKADSDIKEAMAAFAKYGVEVAFLSPTPTGMEKSIMDATSSVRMFLRENEIHDFNKQGQGPKNKKNVPAFFVEKNDLIISKASLYRPKTKKGDPRIWFTKLNQYANSRNLLALLSDDCSLYVVNISIKSIFSSLEIEGSPLNQLVKSISNKHNKNAEKLLNEIRKVTSGRYIPSIKKGDTAVGHLLETLLGIKQNSKKAPDIYGIELKSGRIGKNRKTLFAQVPDWAISKLKSSTEIVDKYGYDREGARKLYCTVSTKKPNSQGLILIADEKNDLLNEKHFSNNGKYEDVVCWKFEILRNVLKAKHAETFWIDVKSENINGVEHFKYTTITHSRTPLLQNFFNLIELGAITIDHLIKKPIGKNTAKEKGPLFKISKKDFAELFPPTIKYEI